uniref:Immunoglobulin V-set domain-containing protein n=1 Tax=Canis lupus familiaris TaxID=9615 RepID=A0A8P0P9F4_CANLF
MAWTVFLLGLLVYGSGADSQTVVTKDPSLSVSGGTVTFTCGLSSGSVFTSNYPSWYQQTHGRAPRMLIYSTSSCPSGVPDRFSGSTSGNKVALTITGAQPEDETIIVHCVWVVHLHSDLNLWGGATKTSSWAQKSSALKAGEGHLLSAQGVILEFWDRVPHRAPCMEPASPSAYVSASLCVSHE